MRTKTNSTLGKVLAASARRMDLPTKASEGDSYDENDDDQGEDFGAQALSATILLLF